MGRAAQRALNLSFPQLAVDNFPAFWSVVICRVFNPTKHCVVYQTEEGRLKMARKAIAHYNTLNKNRSHGDLAVYEEFGRRLQARMIQLGWNQSELSRRATENLPKVSKGQVQGHTLGRDRISSYIRGKYLPRPEALAAIAKALKCQPEDLLPEGGVPSVVEQSPAMEMKSLEGGRVAIRLNRVVSQATALAIMTLLAKEDAL